MNWWQRLSNKVKNNQITPGVELVDDEQIRRVDITVHDIALRTL
jgi:hypothetical protein